jgi:hypothetical protein
LSTWLRGKLLSLSLSPLAYKYQESWAGTLSALAPTVYLACSEQFDALYLESDKFKLQHNFFPALNAALLL